MKTNVKPFCFIMVLLSLGTCATAQTFTPLVNFNGDDGANPQAGLVVSGGTLYGTTYGGGSWGAGTVFAVNIGGGGLTNVYSFTGGNDGSGPQAGLILSANMLYGTTELGGASNYGVVFAVNTNGGGFTNIYSFNGGGDGADPEAGLVLMGNTLFGTTFIGGQSGNGSVFRVNTDGTAFTNIYSFSGGTNGGNPEAGLVLSGNTLYGTTYGPYYGGSSGYGTVFSVKTDGSSFSNVYSFSGGVDGANPEAGLVLSGNTLYGTTANGGNSDWGTVFKVNTNAAASAVIFSMAPTGPIHRRGCCYRATCSSGQRPMAALRVGERYSKSIQAAAASPMFTHSPGAPTGPIPEAGLVLLGATLYGTTQADNGLVTGQCSRCLCLVCPSC